IPRASSSRASASSPATRRPSSSAMTSVATFFPIRLVVAASGDFQVDKNLISAANSVTLHSTMANALQRTSLMNDSSTRIHLTYAETSPFAYGRHPAADGGKRSAPTIFCDRRGESPATARIHAKECLRRRPSFCCDVSSTPMVHAARTQHGDIAANDPNVLVRGLRRIRSQTFSTRILIGLVSGVLLGLFLGDRAIVLKWA